MDTEQLETLLSRVAELVDQKKTTLIRQFQDPENTLSSSSLRELSKGELIAEIGFYEFQGYVRDKLVSYEETQTGSPIRFK